MWLKFKTFRAGAGLAVGLQNSLRRLPIMTIANNAERVGTQNGFRTSAQPPFAEQCTGAEMFCS
jgi:hypothetical protein